MFSDESYTISRRKTEGIFYTPDFVTEYICRNTIIPFLSKTGTNNIQKLITEYQKNIQDLDEKLRSITVLDPACGSGVFLLKAIEILLEIKREIFNFKNLRGDCLTFDARVETKEISRNNIYGVDLNKESVDVTQLSIFQKYCQRDEKPVKSSRMIKPGNALIDDPAIAGDKAFNWEKEFLLILPRGKIDVIIGNPPWGAAFGDQELLFLKKRYKSVTTRTVNSFKMFIQRALELLNPHGAFGFILPNSLIEMPDYVDLRKLILNHSKTLKIIDLGDEVFQKVNTPSCIITFPHDKGDNLLLFKDMKSFPRNNLTTSELEKPPFTELSIDQLDDKLRFRGDELAFLRQNTVLLREKYYEIFGVKVYQTGKGISSTDPNSKQTPQDKANNVYLSSTKTDGHDDRFIDGINIDRFILLWRAGLKDSYINYGNHLAEPRNREIFQQKKVVVQQIVNQYISAAYVEDPYIVKNTCAVITERDPKYSLIFLLGLFESKLFMYIHLMQSANAVKKGYPKLNSDDIKRFPLPTIDENNQSLISELESNTQQLLEEGAVYKENLEDFTNYLLNHFKTDISKDYLKIHQFVRLGTEKFKDFLRKHHIDLSGPNFNNIMNFYARFEKFLSLVDEICEKNDIIIFKLYQIEADVVKKIGNCITSNLP